MCLCENNGNSLKHGRITILLHVVLLNWWHFVNNADNLFYDYCLVKFSGLS